MKKFARIEGGEVREILKAKELPPFHPDLDWREVTDVLGVGERWTVSGTTWSAPAPTPKREIPANTPANLTDLAAEIQAIKQEFADYKKLNP